MSHAVRKAVIPAAGLGTRFLPATKAQPKEMLPVVDKPAIQYVVEEAVSAGLLDILVVTGRNKRAIEDHFDRSIELEHHLERSGKLDELRDVLGLADLAHLHYARQGEARGLGHAVGVARHHVGEEPFAVLLGDDIMVDSTVLEGMLKVHGEHGAPVVALKRVGRDEISSYGCAAVEPAGGDVVRITGLVEKPPPEEAPSDLAIMGRYLLTPDIFSALERVEPGRGGEIQLTDAIALLLEEREVYGYVFEHGRYDTGKKIDFLRATIELALEREDVGPELRAYLVDLVDRRLR